MLLPLSLINLVLACFAPAMTTPTALNLVRLLHGEDGGHFGMKPCCCQ